MVVIVVLETQRCTLSLTVVQSWIMFVLIVWLWRISESYTKDLMWLTYKIISQIAQLFKLKWKYTKWWLFYVAILKVSFCTPRYFKFILKASHSKSTLIFQVSLFIANVKLFLNTMCFFTEQKSLNTGNFVT